jgi:glycine hydroxymethyltransferase
MTANKNTIPYDEEKPFIGSGLRLGTPALTTRGFREPEMARVANLIADVLEAELKDDTRRRVIAEVEELAEAFPLYPELRAELQPVEIVEGAAAADD